MSGDSYAYPRTYNYVVSRSFTFLLGWAGPPCTRHAVTQLFSSHGTTRSPGHLRSHRLLHRVELDKRPAHQTADARRNSHQSSIDELEKDELLDQHAVADLGLANHRLELLLDLTGRYAIHM